MFGLGRREKAASAGVAIASNLLNQLRSFEYEFGFSALKFEDEPYLIGFLIGYAVTASLSTVKGKQA
jgi:hypothetical protein